MAAFVGAITINVCAKNVRIEHSQFISCLNYAHFEHNYKYFFILIYSIYSVLAFQNGMSILIFYTYNDRL